MGVCLYPRGVELGCCITDLPSLCQLLAFPTDTYCDLGFTSGFDKSVGVPNDRFYGPLS